MIVNIGKRIKVESGDFDFECDADHPGFVIVKKTKRGYNQIIELPGNRQDAQNFIKAYLRCIEEDIEYRKSEVE